MEATEVVIEPSGRSVRFESDYDKLETSWSFLRGCTSRPFVHYRVSQSAFELSAEAGRKGEIASDFEGTAPIRSSRRSGLRSSATVNGGGPRVTLSTDKGKLLIRRG